MTKPAGSSLLIWLGPLFSTPQGGLDPSVPGDGGAGRKPGVVDLGSGRHVQESQERRQDGHEELCQEDAQADRRLGRQGQALM